MKLRYLTPPSLVRNLRLNWRHNGRLDRHRLLLVSPAAELRVDRSARICLEAPAKLNLGFVANDFVHTAPAKLQMLADSRMVVKAGNCTISAGAVVFVASGTTVTFGRNVHVISNTRILAYADIEIGDDCIVGWETQIMSGDGHAAFQHGQWINPPAPVRIGDHVWIGARATILKGVRIGTGAIIGADAVVTKDVPDHYMAGGNPARVLARDVSWKL